MENNDSNDAMSDVELVTISLVPETESSVWDVLGSDSDSCQSDYVSASFYVESLSVRRDGILNTDHAIPISTKNVVETETGHFFDQINVREEVINDSNVTQIVVPVPTELAEFTTQDGIEVTASENVGIDLADVSKMPLFHSKRKSDHNAMPLNKIKSSDWSEGVGHCLSGDSGGVSLKLKSGSSLTNPGRYVQY